MACPTVEGKISFRGTVSLAGVLFVVVTGVLQVILAEVLNEPEVEKIAFGVLGRAAETIFREIDKHAESVLRLANRGGAGVFAEEASGFGCCSLLDVDAKYVAEYDHVRRYHWSNLETNPRVVSSESATVAGSIIGLSRTNNSANLTDAPRPSGNLQWLLSDQSTNFTRQTYLSNTWYSSSFSRAMTSVCGQGFIQLTSQNVAHKLSSQADCDAAAAELFPAIQPSVAMNNGSRPAGCLYNRHTRQIEWNPVGNDTLEEMDELGPISQALCRLPTWFHRESVFNPDCTCNMSWPCKKGFFVPTDDSEFDESRFEQLGPYNATNEDWWKDAVIHSDFAERGNARWSQPAYNVETMELAVPAVLPLFVGDTNIPRAVIKVSLGLGYLDMLIEERVQNITEGKGWIIEVPTDKLIASYPRNLTNRQVGDDWEQIVAVNADDPCISAVSKELLDMFGSFDQVPFDSDEEEKVLFVYIDDQRFLVNVTRFHPKMESENEPTRLSMDGLDWIVVVAAPDDTFFEHMEKARHWAVGGTIVLAVVLGGVLWAITQIVSRHISRLGSRMKRVAQRDFVGITTNLGVERWTFYKEVDSMEISFKRMSSKLKHFWEQEQQQKKDLLREKEASCQRRIDAALGEPNALRHPMVLCQANVFIEEGRLKSYEELRDEGDGKLTILDTVQKIDEFERDHIIVFFSHQWLQWGYPDPTGVHHRTMSNAIRRLQPLMVNPTGEGMPQLEQIYVWCDFSSMSQEHRGMQELAIRSLTIYSSKADAFIVIAPSTSLPDNPDNEFNIRTADKRGWFRMETLAKVCSSGIQDMFLMLEENGGLVELTPDNFKEYLTLQVFEGEFSCCHQCHKKNPYCDRETLVEPVLGLYSEVLRNLARNPEDPSANFVLDQIELDKKAFFPKDGLYKMSDGKEERRELFGEEWSLVRLMEETMKVPNSTAPAYFTPLEGLRRDGSTSSAISQHTLQTQQTQQTSLEGHCSSFNRQKYKKHKSHWRENRGILTGAAHVIRRVSHVFTNPTSESPSISGRS